MQANLLDAAVLADTGTALAELMATRLCHDMASLCGTLEGTLELAAGEPDGSDEAIAVASDSARALSERLRLLRAAWGRAAEKVDRSRVQALAAGLPGAHRLRLCLSGFDMQAALPAPFGRLVLNALLLGAESMPVGGSLSLSGDETGAQVAIVGNRAAWPEALPALLGAPHTAMAVAGRAGPRGLLPPLLVLLAAGCGARLALRDAGGPQPVLDLAPG